MVLDHRKNNAPPPSNLASNGDSYNMALAYRQATEEDTRSVLNAMSDPTKAQELKFYLLPSAWFQACMPYLTNQVTERPLHTIPTADLLASEHAVSDEDSDAATQSTSNVSNHVVLNGTTASNADEHRKRRRQKWQDKTRKFSDIPENIAIQRDMQHNRHYYLVGRNVWTLLSHKFGCDVAIGRDCVASPSQRGQLGVRIDETTLIPIPLSGYFTYSSRSGAEERDEVVGHQQPHDAQPQDADFVSEDDSEHGNDLFPTTEGVNDDLFGPDDDAKMPPAIDCEAPPDTDYDTLPLLTNNLKDANSDQLVMAPSPAKRKRFASGLGNLGNTCFMNSTLQCLAHTEPIRRYFVTGEYKSDLNRDNPLGTGGELATQFADLLSEMWGTLRHVERPSSLYGGISSLNSTAYPRSFKNALGRHAEQFLGYDQHDSQEFATYLLDALHEDTNRVTKKPYIEKPEQGEDETDDIAADKAWNLHLQREDSRVLENFMGQVKSRVQCPTEGCGRVSTTFDPFMYLSVPIPGSTAKSYPLTFVPLKGPKLNFTLKANMNSSFAGFRVKISKELKKTRGIEVDPDDLTLVDMWNNEAYRWYKDDEHLDQVRDQDETYVYELQPKSYFASPLKDKYEDMLTDLNAGSIESQVTVPSIVEERLKLLPFDWQRDIEHCVKKPTLSLSLFNSKRFQLDDLFNFYKQLEGFLLECSNSLQSVTVPELLNESDETLVDLSQASSTFEIATRLDFYSLLRRSSSLHGYILDRARKTIVKRKEGILVSVDMRSTDRFTANKGFAPPMCLRIHQDMSVYDFRLLLSARLKSCLETDYLGQMLPEKTTESDGLLKDDTVTDIGQDEDPVAAASSSDDSAVLRAPELPSSTSQGSSDSATFGPPETLILRQIPITFDRKGSYERNMYSNNVGRSLGALSRDGNGATGGRVVSLASPSDPQELESVADIVGQRGAVHLHWSPELLNRCLNKRKYEAEEDLSPLDDTGGIRTRRQVKVWTILDCIEKYCQREQLEETEMWYCDRCKDHVCAWKQFHLYRTPPILIVHLKRFHYQSSTHRREKIEDFIDFPLVGLDLTDKVMRWSDDEKPIYDCYAVSNHFGGLGGGHYTAYALSDEGEWCNFDDSRVSTAVDPKEVVSAAAYVLYYRRRDVALNDWQFVDPPLPAIVQDHADVKMKAVDGTRHVTVQEALDAEMNSATSSKATCSSPMESVHRDDGDEADDLFQEDDSEDYASAAAVIPGPFQRNLGMPPQ